MTAIIKPTGRVPAIGSGTKRLGLSLALVLLGAGAGSADAQPTHRMHELAHKLARQHAQETKPQVYYRPFCRRSHYATYRSAPCWN